MAMGSRFGRPAHEAEAQHENTVSELPITSSTSPASSVAHAASVTGRGTFSPKKTTLGLSTPWQRAQSTTRKPSVPVSSASPSA